ncbi:WD_REPEATS_REGION domain-containing protein, partial [Mortierella sp. GBA35]
MSNHPIDQPGSHALGSDSSYATPPLRSRDKFFGLLGIPKYKAKIKAKTSSQSLNTEGDEQVKKSSPFASQASAFLSEDYHSVSASVAEDKFLPVPPAEKGQPLLNVFPENMSKPVIRTKLPALQDRIEMTQQLVYCHSLLLKGSAATTINDRLQGNDSQESVLDETERAWVRVVQQNSSQQHHLRWLVTKIVKEFAKDDLEGPDAIAEAVILGSVLDRATYRSLISCFITKFEQATILDIALLQGLVQLIESASSGYLQDDDLVRTLGVLRRRLRGTHKQSSEHVCQMTLAISRLLDVMVNGMVKDLNRTVDHQPLMAILTELKDTSDPILHFQVAYALQALQYVPDDESTLQAVLRFAGGVAMAALGVASICKLDPANLFNSLDTLRQAAGQSYEVTKSFLEGMEASQRGRFGAMQSLLKGIRAGTRHEWYLTLLAAKSFVRDGRLADFKRTVCDAPCRDECAFQLGVCQILGDIAMDPLWDSSTRHQAIDFLGALHRNIIGWKQYSDSKEWIFSILTQMSGLSDEAVKEHAAAALQDLGQEDATITSMSFPLKSRLSLPELSPLLTSIHQIPDVEHHLHKVQLQRLEEVKLPVYIPPMAKANLQAKDEDLFSLMEKVEEFLSSDRQVALILGDSGAGKSTFNKHLEKELLQSYQSGGRIPLFVNLPALDRPDKDLMTEQLRAHNFSDAQIQELKLRREFIVICDGYDESQLICNLHTTNNFNRPGQWKVKLVISCRTQYLGPDYQDRFVPKAVDQYQRAASDLFQEAIIAPFSKNQIETYVEKYIPLEPRTWVKKDYMDKLTAIPHLMDMVKNPFLLTIALEALPGVIQRKRDLSTVRITRVQLYDIFVEHWLGVNKRRLQGQNLSGDHQRVLDELLEDGFEENGIKFQKELATAIFVEQEGRPVVDYVHKRNKDTWKAAFFRPDPEPTLLRNACLLNRAGTQYRFMHRSVLEYFYSRHIYDSIVLDENPSLELPTESTTPIVSQPLSQMNLVAEPSITEFLAERVQSDPAFKQQLLAII